MLEKTVFFFFFFFFFFHKGSVISCVEMTGKIKLEKWPSDLLQP